MSKKRGLSVEDKREIILKVYHDKKEPFNLKEIENLGSKLGVVQQTIKDVNQSLVDDFMVQTDKIGSANFYWSFPSKYYQDISLERERNIQTLNRLNNSIEEQKKQIEVMKQDRVGDDRPEKLRRLAELKTHERELNEMISANKMNDPEEIKKVEDQIDTILEGVNRWTDNTWAVKKFLTKKKGMSGKEVDKMLKMDSDFDNVDLNTLRELSSKSRKA